MKKQSRPDIVWMIRRHLEEDVLAIEQASFPYPWSKEEFISALRERNTIGMVCEVDAVVVGYMIYHLHKNRLHILNFCVDEKHRRNGYGSAMIQKLVGKLSYQRRNRITLEVSDSNLAAQLFFKSQGFRAVDILKDFYEDCDDDAYVMVYKHLEDAECVG